MNWGDARSWAATWEWGDAPAWAAFALAAIALWISVKTQKDGRRSADAAQQSAVDGKRSADAAERSAIDGRRSADAAEASLAHEREVAQAAAAASRPRPILRIERTDSRSSGSYRLVNVGDASAVGLTLAEDSREEIYGAPGDLACGEAFSFMFRSGAGAPDQLWFTWDGQVDPVPVTVPPY